MFKNNRFTDDTHEEHNQRVMLCAAAAALYSVELGLRPSWVADIATYSGTFSALLDAQNIEDAEWHGAIADLEAKRVALFDHNSDARWMVKTILDDPDLSAGDKRMIDDAFDIDVKLRKNVAILATATKALLEGQEKLVEIGAAWGLPAGMVTNLTDGLTAMETSFRDGKKKHGEKLKATEDIYDARETGEMLLRNIFRWAMAVWGEDDNRLLELGCVPKSQIWTPGMPEPGEPEEPVFPEKFENFEAKFQSEPSPMNVVGWDQYADCDFARLFRAKVLIGEAAPERPSLVWQDDITENPIADTNVEPGFAHYYWVCAVKDGVEGEFAMASEEYV